MPPETFVAVVAVVAEVALVADVAVEADVAVAAFPVMLMPHEPEAPEPPVDGASIADRAPAAVVAPVPPFASASVPANVTAPVVADEGVSPVEPPEKVRTPAVRVDQLSVPAPFVAKKAPLEPSALGKV